MNTKQLRQKILDLAIRGKLVPQDPNDEPATVLLERIRAEKERLITEGKVRRDKKSCNKICDDYSFQYEQLPNGWKYVRLSDICILITDGTHQTPTYSDDGYVFLSSKNVTTGKIDWSNVMYIPQELHDVLYKRLAPEVGDILLAKNGTTGYAAVVDKDYVFDIYVSLALLRTFKNEILPEYLRHIISSEFVQSHFKGNLKGIGVPNLHLEHIKSAIVPICSLAEQQRIVAAIESAFAVVDEIERNKADLQAAVTAAKQKILSLAIRGKLVPQDPNDEPAERLLGQIGAEKQQGSFDLSKNWVWAKMNCVCEPQETKRPTGDVFRYIDINSIDNKRHMVTEPKSILTDEAPSRAAKGVAHGDTLFSMVRPYLENIAFVTDDLSGCIASTGFYVCRPRRGIVFPKYLYYFLISCYAISGLNSFMRGDNSPAIRKNEMDGFLVPIPPFAEQRCVVAAIEAAFEQLDRITAELK